MNREFFADADPAPAATGAPKNPSTPPIPGPDPQKIPPQTQAGPWMPPPPKPRQPIPATSVDGVYALLFFGLGYLYLQLVFFTVPGLGVFLFALLFTGVVLSYHRRTGGTVPQESAPWLALVLVSAAGFLFLSNRTLRELDLLFLTAAAAYWVAALKGTRLEDRIGGLLPLDLLVHLFLYPFANFGCQGAVIKKSLCQKKSGRTVLTVALTLLCSLPLLFWIASLLAQADHSFQRLLNFVLGLSGYRFGWTILKLLLAIPVSCYLFGLVYGAAHKRGAPKFTAASVQAKAERCRVLSLTVSRTLLILLILLYFVFFAAQAADLFAAFLGKRPDDLTYAQYARTGFFELCRVAVANLAVLWATRTFSRREPASPRPLAALHTILSCQTLLLIATALSKMALYIRAQGLTHLRLYTSWFMVLLAAVFLVLTAANWKAIRQARWLAAIFCVWFMILCYANVDGLIATYNIRQYQSGALAELDVSVLDQCGDAAVPAIAKLYQTSDDPVLREDLTPLLSWSFYRKDLWKDDPLAFLIAGNFQQVRAQLALNDAFWQALYAPQIPE